MRFAEADCVNLARGPRATVALARRMRMNRQRLALAFVLAVCLGAESARSFPAVEAGRRSGLKRAPLARSGSFSAALQLFRDMALYMAFVRAVFHCHAGNRQWSTYAVGAISV